MWRAILIGVDTYDDSSFSALKYPIHDVQEVGRLLLDPQIGGFDEKSVVLLPNESDGKIRECLGRVFSLAEPNDLIFVYFAGHSRTDRNDHLCLAARNTRFDTPVGTSIHIDEMRAMWQNSRAKRMVLILDSCFSGAVGETLRGDVPGTSLEQMSGEGKVIISSSKAFQAARERDDLRHGIFTHYLLEGLSTGKADENKDGFVGAVELYRYVHKRMQEEKVPQTPQLWGEEQTGEIILAKSISALQQRQVELERLEEKRLKLLTWWNDGAIPTEIYDRAMKLLELEADKATDRERKLLRVLDNAFEGRLDLPVFRTTWALIEKPERRREAQIEFETAQHVDTQKAWEDYLHRYEGVSKEQDEEARKHLDASKRQRGENTRPEDPALVQATEARSPLRTPATPAEAEKVAYEAALQRGTVDAWFEFLSRYPDSPSRAEVLTRISSLLHPSPGPTASPLRRIGADFVDYLLALFTINLVQVIYFFLIPLTGKTLGHRLMGTSILDKQKKRLGYGRGLAYLFSWGAWWGIYLVLGVYVAERLDRGFIEENLALTSFFLVAFGGPLLGTGLIARMNAQSRSLYDFVAGTIVLRDQKAGGPAKTVALHPGPWRRFAADLIDVASLFCTGIAFAALVIIVRAGLQGVQLSFSLVQVFTERLPLVVFTVLWFCYYALAFLRFGQTLGSNLMGFRLLGKDRSSPTWSNTLRYAGCLLTSLVCSVGIVMHPHLSPQHGWFDVALAMPVLVFLLNPLAVRKWQRSLYDFASATQALRVQGGTG